MNNNSPEVKLSSFDEILTGLLSLLEGYNSVHRKSIQPYTRQKVYQRFPDYVSCFDDLVIRESLLEHVGCLPVLATYLHPYLDKPVDLGKALIMISIHDIGEIHVGDELTFLKSAEQGEAEVAAALSLLHEDHKPLYLEADALTTNEALYVKSIDKLAPDILDYLCGEDYSIRRMVEQAGWAAEAVMRNVRSKKRPFMEWSTLMTGVHDALFRKFASQTELS